MANFRPPTHPLLSTWLLNAPLSGMPFHNIKSVLLNFITAALYVRANLIYISLPMTEVAMVPGFLGFAGRILGVLDVCTPKGSYTGVAEIIGGSE